MVLHVLNKNEHLFYWLKQCCTMSIVECNVCLSQWWGICRCHWHNEETYNDASTYVSIGWIHWKCWSGKHCTNLYKQCLKMRNVTNLLIHYFPNIYFQSCVIHCLDLLLKDWGKKTWAKQILPMKLLFLMDNCAKDNKNKYFLAFLSCWQWKKPLKRFGYLSKKIME